MKAMRLRCTIPMLILGGTVAAASAQTPAPFTLRISGPGTVAAGQPVQVRVLLQNTSDHPISVEVPNMILLDGSALSIQGPTGQYLPRKKGGWGGSMGWRGVNPGDVWDDVLRVDSFYDLSQPGKYTLQLKRPIAEDRSDKDGLVSSNVITVTVSPDAVKPSAPLALTLSGPETFASGSDVSLKVLAKNVSDQDVFLVTDPDGSVANSSCGVHNVVRPPNGFQFGQTLAHDGPKIVQTISPGATLEAKLDKKAMGFKAEWTPPAPYQLQLICSFPGYSENDRSVSNAFTMDVTPAPAGGPTPFTLKLSGPQTVAAGDAVRVVLEETNTSDFGGLGLMGQLDPLEPFISQLGYSFSVRDPSGHELPLNTHANIVPGSHSVKSTETGPCNSYAVLSDYYDFSQPGAYRVQLSRYDKPLGDVRVFSNVLTINVTPAAQR
jgi:hypothetical protein